MSADYEILPESAGTHPLQCNRCDLVIATFDRPVRKMREHIREKHRPPPTVWDTIQEEPPDIGNWRDFREPENEWRSRLQSEWQDET